MSPQIVLQIVVLPGYGMDMAETRRHLGMVVEDQINAAQGADILDRAAKKRLGITGAEFVSRWDRGDYADLDHVTVMEVAALIPLAR